jgi:hypothetical protein
MPQCEVPKPRVVEALEYSAEKPSWPLTVRPPVTVNQLPLLEAESKLSAIELSYASATEPIEGRLPQDVGSIRISMRDAAGRGSDSSYDAARVVTPCVVHGSSRRRSLPARGCLRLVQTLR